MKPTLKKPKSIIAQVDGSGTGVVKVRSTKAKSPRALEVPPSPGSNTRLVKSSGVVSVTNHSPAPVLLAADSLVTVPSTLRVSECAPIAVRVIEEDGPASPNSAISFTVSPWNPLGYKKDTSKDVSKCWPEMDVKVMFSWLSISPPTTDPLPPTPTP